MRRRVVSGSPKAPPCTRTYLALKTTVCAAPTTDTKGSACVADTTRPTKEEPLVFQPAVHTIRYNLVTA